MFHVKLLSGDKEQARYARERGCEGASVRERVRGARERGARGEGRGREGAGARECKSGSVRVRVRVRVRVCTYPYVYVHLRVSRETRCRDEPRVKGAAGTSHVGASPVQGKRFPLLIWEGMGGWPNDQHGRSATTRSGTREMSGHRAAHTPVLGQAPLPSSERTPARTLARPRPPTLHGCPMGRST